MNRFFRLGKVCAYFLCALSVISVTNGYAGTLTVCGPDLGCGPDTYTYNYSPLPPPIEVFLPTPIVMTPIFILDPINVGFVNLIDFGFLESIQTPTGWQYVFGLMGITSMTIPLFSDAMLSNIMGTTEWALSTGTTDVFGLGHGAGYMTWTYTGANDATVPSFFLFESPFGPASTTDQIVSKDGTIVNTSAFIPLSPLALSAGLQPPTVPEPETVALVFIGIAALIATRRRRLA